MKYQCKSCGKEFDLPATITYQPVIKLPLNAPFPVPPTAGPWPSSLAQPTNQVSFNYDINHPCCPHCYSTDIEEVKQ